MEKNELEIAKAFIVVEIIEYIHGAIAVKTIMKKTTGTVTAVSFDSSELLTEKTIPFDTFIQIIDGKAEIVIDGISNFLDIGNSIIVPAHAKSIIKPNQHFKMISTIIKSGYE